MAQGVPGRLRPRIFSTFGTTRVVGRQPNAPATFTPGEIPGTHFQKLSRSQEGTTKKKKIPSDTTGDRSRDHPTIAQRLSHYATSGSHIYIYIYIYIYKHTHKKLYSWWYVY